MRTARTCHRRCPPWKWDRACRVRGKGGAARSTFAEVFLEDSRSGEADADAGKHAQPRTRATDAAEPYAGQSEAHAGQEAQPGRGTAEAAQPGSWQDPRSGGAPSNSRIGIGHPGHSGQWQYRDRRYAEQSCCRAADWRASLSCCSPSLVCLLVCVLALIAAGRTSAGSCPAEVKVRTRTCTMVSPGLFGHRQGLCPRLLEQAGT